MNRLITTEIKRFRKTWSADPDVIGVAPGRVNIIGEHTDYTGGFVLPAAIDKEVVFAARKIHGNIISGFSMNFSEEASCKIGEYDSKHPCGWFRYIMGVLAELERKDVLIEGFNFTVGGNVPIGSGLSSSAALEMAVLTAMEDLFRFQLDDKEAALLCQRAENNFVGVNCGIMDQYIARTGKKDHAILIDCTDLSVNAIKINTPSYAWLIIDSKKRRELVESEYNNRRMECEKGVSSTQTAFPKRNIKGLRGISLDDLRTLKSSCSENVFRRVKHVITENNRVLNTVRALEAGNIDVVGKNLYASHASLRDDFEVSCKELDTLVEILSEIDGVSGARLTGAGFGGCLIALVRKDSVKTVERAMRKKYHPKSLPEGENAEIWTINISDGARSFN